MRRKTFLWKASTKAKVIPASMYIPITSMIGFRLPWSTKTQYMKSIGLTSMNLKSLTSIR